MHFLTEPKLLKLNELLNDSSRDEIVWMNGYLAGILSLKNGSNAKLNGSAESSPLGSVVDAGVSVKKISVLFGTETGNSKKVALQLAAESKSKGIVAKVTGLDQYRFSDLEKERHVFVVISTQGEGEPPATAKKFFDFLRQQKPSLSHIEFSVLALGDSAYPHFCQAGKDLDALFESVGAKRIAPLVLADTSFEAPAKEWISSIFPALSSAKSAISITQKSASVSKNGSEKQWFEGVVGRNSTLNDRGSSKKTNHIEIQLAESVDYEPGDAIAILPENGDGEISEIFDRTVIPTLKVIEHSKETARASFLLKKVLNISNLSSRVLEAYGKLAGKEIPDGKYSFVDLIKAFPLADSAAYEKAIVLLEPISPRLYSISSSPAAHTDEIHLTVALNVFESKGKVKKGVGSCYLCDLTEGAKLKFYIHKNRHFKLPDSEKDIIMIGPGTGIAPFRSFVAERDATGAAGRSWLFFGEQRFTTDFYYQTEWQNHLQSGALTKLSVAFSRDQSERIYVQHKLRQHAAEVVRWLESGAYLYVCGAKAPMSFDVEQTLVSILREQKNWETENAVNFVEQLKSEGRYVKDVY